jgi:hypothetical protein
MKKAFVVIAFALGMNASAQNVKQVALMEKKNVVNIFPNPSSNGSFQISSNEKVNLSFYVFDLSGTLVHQATLKGKEKHIIQNLNKGTYIYDVFKNDEGIEHGRLVVK